MLLDTKTEKKNVAKKLQALANELNTNTVEFKRLRALDATPEYSIGFILRDTEILANTFYHLGNEIKKLKLQVNYLRCLANKEIYDAKRTIAYNELANSYLGFDDIDF